VGSNRRQRATGTWRNGNNLLVRQAPHVERVLLRAIPCNAATRSALAV
jgi:hypothetical protein